ncbi:MAG: right-handed parallel beta-helix repeat-containing protein [Spirochaetaceae bacterium]|nr:right-handed parallel beta-helix repeat-containing protein [Spirochaetaceae bacterium]
MAKAQAAPPAPPPSLALFDAASGEELAARKAAILGDPKRYATVGASGCEFISISAALLSLGANPRIIVVLDQVHIESGIVIDRDATIAGLGATSTTVEAAIEPEDAEDRVFLVKRGARAAISGLTIRGGKIADVPRRGGGVANSGELVLEDCAIVDNLSTYGCGVWTEGRLVMRRCAVVGNRGLKRPIEDELRAIDCGGKGAGMRVEKGGDALLEDCLIAYNQSVSAGGALHVSCEARAELRNCTLYANVAKGRGGAIDLAGGVLSLVGCTIASNTSTGPGAGIYNRGKLSAVGCLFAGQGRRDYFLGEDGGGDQGRGSLVLNLGNFSESGSLPDSAAGDAKLGVLARNGGPLPTCALEPGSPALGRVDPALLPALDARGKPRLLYPNDYAAAGAWGGAD